MYNISSIYPNDNYSHFNYGYYLNIYMPMSIKLLSIDQARVSVCLFCVSHCLRHLANTGNLCLSA